MNKTYRFLPAGLLAFVLTMAGPPVPTRAADQGETASTLWQQSLAFEKESNYDAAIAKTMEFAKKSGDLYLGFVRCGWLNLQAKRYDVAQQHYSAAAKLEPAAITPWSGLAAAYYAGGDHTKAESAYQQVLARDPSNYTALQAMAAIAFEKRDYRTACRYYETVTRLYPEDATGLSGSGWSRLYTNRKGDATASFRRLLLISPDFLYARDGYNTSIAGRILSDKLP